MHPAEAPTPRRHNSLVPDSTDATSPSSSPGGGINGVLLELGFLKRLSRDAVCGRESGGSTERRPARSQGRWPPSDRLDELEEFLLELQADDAFRPRAVWQFPRRAPRLHAARTTVAASDRVARGARIRARRRRHRARRLRDGRAATTRRATRRATSSSSTPSHSTEPETMGRAILASAAISGLVLPDPGRRPHRDRRRLGAQLPARARVPQSRRSPRSPRSDTSRATADGRRIPRAHARATRALSRRPARTGAAGRGPARRRSAPRAASRPTTAS